MSLERMFPFEDVTSNIFNLVSALYEHRQADYEGITLSIFEDPLVARLHFVTILAILTGVLHRHADEKGLEGGPVGLLGDYLAEARVRNEFIVEALSDLREVLGEDVSVTDLFGDDPEQSGWVGPPGSQGV